MYSGAQLKRNVITQCEVNNNIVFLGEFPSLPELLRLKIPQHVATKHKTFGIFLLDDATGSRVDGMK